MSTVSIARESGATAVGSAAEAAEVAWTRSLTIAILALGVTQIIGWGSIYYALTILGPSISHDLGWPSQWTYVGFSAALVMAGASAPFAGRLLDRHGGRIVMSAGSVVAALGLLLLATCTGWWTYLLAWLVLGIAKSMVLYEAAFATVAQAAVNEARRAITYISFFGGLASTFAWPATRLLHDALGWRATYLVYAALAIAVCLPLHWLALPKRAIGGASTLAGDRAPAQEATTSPWFRTLATVLLSTSFAMGSFMWSGVSVHFLTLLGMLGFSTAAAVGIGSVIGPSQVLGRIGDLLVGARFHPLRVMQVAATMLPVAFTILILGGGSSVAAVVFAVLYGVAIGMNTIARGAVPLALFGPVGYGARLGRMAAPAFLAEAAAPVAYAAMIGVAGAEGGFLLAAAATVGSFLAVTALSLAWRREMRAGKKK